MIMDIFNNLILGFTVALSLQNIIYCFVGVVVGTAIGVLPGVGPLVTIAMLLPITFNLAPVPALIMLAGISVSNAILLVDYTNILRRRDGLSVFDAVTKAGRTRLRPILMTTATTILGLLPMAFGLGEGGEVQAPMARVVGWRVEGVEPSVMGIGPVPAVRGLESDTGIRLAEIDLVELNEAFASQSLACVKELGIDPKKVNVNGGAIALGHPLGCSGARIMTTLIHEMKRRGSTYGLATLCIGVGQGIATIVERVR